MIQNNAFSNLPAFLHRLHREHGYVKVQQLYYFFLITAVKITVETGLSHLIGKDKI